MITTRLVTTLVGLLISLSWVQAEKSASASTFNVALDAEQGTLELRYHGRKVMVYAFSTNQFKPYVRELWTLQGDNILLDAPSDHLHHHGLMYAVRVNGVNFWEERDSPGYEKTVALSPVEVGISPDGLPQASFQQKILWLPKKDAALTEADASLIERRTLTVTVNEVLQEVALSWKAHFDVGLAVNKVTLAGATYFGLGMRFPRTFDLYARHENSEGKPYLTFGKADLTAARWSSVSRELAGRNISMAIFAEESAERGLPIFFSMLQPFTYLSATQGLDKESIEYAAGKSFDLNFLVVAYPEQREAAFYGQRYRAWAHPAK